LNSNKIKNYKLTGSIHTLFVKSEGTVENIMDEVKACIYPRPEKQNSGKETITRSKINPNKLMGEIYTFSEFQTAMETILSGAGITEYRTVRVDMRFDSYDATHYRKYAKLNRYIISALAVTNKMYNTYLTRKLFTEEQLSVATKNSYFEIENYDKDVESHGRDKAKSRLEIRSKRLLEQAEDIPTLYKENWSRKLDKAIANMELVHAKYNEALENEYKSQKDQTPRRFRKLIDFLMQNQERIFCKAQLVDLLTRIGENDDPVASAEYYKKKIGMEYFSQNDVRAAVKEIKRAIHEFFEK